MSSRRALRAARSALPISARLPNVTLAFCPTGSLVIRTDSYRQVPLAWRLASWNDRGFVRKLAEIGVERRQINEQSAVLVQQRLGIGGGATPREQCWDRAPACAMIRKRGDSAGQSVLDQLPDDLA